MGYGEHCERLAGEGVGSGSLRDYTSEPEEREDAEKNFSAMLEVEKQLREQLVTERRLRQSVELSNLAYINKKEELEQQLDTEREAKQEVTNYAAELEDRFQAFVDALKNVFEEHNRHEAEDYRNE